MENVEYSFQPIIDKRSKVLILGSLPGVRSLRENEYYANGQNSFWKIMFSVFVMPYSSDYRTKIGLLAENRIALWDVIKSAERTGSSDSSIRTAIPNDVPGLLKGYPAISSIIFNGGFAFRSYRNYFGKPHLPHTTLLSTSPACAGRDRERRFAFASLRSWGRVHDDWLRGNLRAGHFCGTARRGRLREELLRHSSAARRA